MANRTADRQVVADLSLSVAAGEIVGLLGPNGAGKSTTVAMLCGLVGADQGQVCVGTGASRLELTENTPDAKRRIGVVPQELSIYENLGAAANLTLFGALYGLAGALLRERVDAALQLVGLADRAGDKPQLFSGGMKRRLNIAAALVHDPDVLIFDEPTVGVDPQSRNAIFDNLELLRDRGKALLYTTHYMEEAERLCDRVVIMDHGKVVASDTLQGLYKRLPAVDTLELEIDGTVDLVALGGEPGIDPAEPGRDAPACRRRRSRPCRAGAAVVARRARPCGAPHLVGSRRPRGRLPVAHRPPTQGLNEP